MGRRIVIDSILRVLRLRRDFDEARFSSSTSLECTRKHLTNAMMQPTHAYEVRPRKEYRGVDLISD